MYAALYIFLSLSIMNNISRVLEVAENNSFGSINTRTAILWNVFCIIFAVGLIACFACR